MLIVVIIMVRLKKKDYDNINNRINNNNDHNNGDSNDDYADHKNEYTQIKEGKKKEEKTWVDCFFCFLFRKRSQV